MADMKNFVFYESWYEVLEEERQEVQWEVIHAVMEYVFRDNLVELKPNSKMAFKFIKRDIDRAKEAHKVYLEKQRQNGLKGGRPIEKSVTQQNPNIPVVISETQKSHKEKVKVKEKVKESEGESAIAYTPTQIQSFNNFQSWIQTNANRVMQMKKPFTISEYFKIVKQIPKQQIEELLLAMENRSDLLRKYQSAYLTITKWHNMNFNTQNQSNESTKPISTDPELEAQRKAKKAASQ